MTHADLKGLAVSTLQRLACRQLVLRAGEVGLAPDAPELLAARQMLQAAA